jgi:hypothetical protein
MRKYRKVYKGESPKERAHSEETGVDGRMGSEWSLRRLARGVEWIQLAYDVGRWHTIMKTVITFRFWRHVLSDFFLS